MSASMFNVATVKAAPKTPAVGFAAAAGLLGFLTYNNMAAVLKTSNEQIPSLEQQFGTADGYFPSATPGARLNKLPGNHLKIAGEHYVPNAERRSYATKRLTKMNTKREEPAV